jgi:uncharacterized cupin superfamily protein
MLFGMSVRPPFVVSSESVAEKSDRYPNSEELLAPSRAIGSAAGLRKIGLHLYTIAPGQRISWPHAEESDEEFVFVIQGEVDAWIDGHLHPMRAGDLAAFPAGTGICHTFINNSGTPAQVLGGGESTSPTNRIYYPLHQERALDMLASRWWQDIPLRSQGPHDGRPNGSLAPRAGPTRAGDP